MSFFVAITCSLFFFFVACKDVLLLYALLISFFAGTTHCSLTQNVLARSNKWLKHLSLMAFFARTQFLLELTCLAKNLKTVTSLSHHTLFVYVHFFRSHLCELPTFFLAALFDYFPFVNQRHIFEGNLTSGPMTRFFSLGSAESLDKKEIEST